MKAGDHIIQRLYGRDKHLSGEVLASELGISRAAVSQQVAELKKAGWPIQSGTNLGYLLRGTGSMISAALCTSLLAGRGIDCQVVHFDSIGSTNTWALEHLDRLPALAVVSADEQTAGRGRFDRPFHSPSRTGLYMSLVIKERISAGNAALVTCAAAVAARRAVEGCTGISLGIKWVNDLMADGRKVGGILTEGRMDMESGSLVNAVIGIGINIRTADFPPDIASRAASLLSPESRESDLDRNALLCALAAELATLVRSLPERSFMDEYRSASTVLGMDLELRRWDQVIRGRAIEIDTMGQLILQQADGQLITCNSGEVTSAHRSHT